VRVENWGPLSYSRDGTLATSAEATASTLSTAITWTGVPPQGKDSVVIQRGGDFHVTGSGQVAFSMNYSLNGYRLIDTASLSYPFIYSSAQVDAFVFVNALGDEAIGIHRLFPTIGSVNESFAHSGTLTYQKHLSDGGVYTFRVIAESTAVIQATEPSSLLLLGVGFAAFIVAPLVLRSLSSRPS
jgi:hypothetical protein